MAQTLPILMYHSVDTRSSNAYRRWVITPEQFGRHLDFLAAQDCRPITISALSAAMRERQILPPGTVAITFDDGLRDFLTGAMPHLLRHRFAATLFVVTGYVGSTSRWLQHLGEAGRPMLSWADLRDLSECGIECGAHTRTHPQLDIMPPSTAFAEIRGSKCDLEDRLGRSVSAFAYPHGYASRTTRALVAKAGFTSACRVRHALSSTGEDLFVLSRIIVTEDLGEDRLISLVGGAGLPVAPPPDRLAGLGWRLVRKVRHLNQGSISGSFDARVVMNGHTSRTIDVLLGLASAGARLAAPITRSSSLEGADWKFLRELRGSGGANATWRSVGIARTEGDGSVVFLADGISDRHSAEPCRPPAGASAVLKRASSKQGISALERNCRKIELLKAEPRLVELSSLLPDILAVQRLPNTMRLIEKLMPGEEGRTIIQRSECRLKALSAAKATMADVHAQTASVVVIGDSWLEKWVNRPAALLEQPIRSLMSLKNRRVAVEAFAQWQRAFWRGRSVRLGWCHGDFSPGNILFSTPGDLSRVSKLDGAGGLSVSGIIDWDRAQPDAPPGLDACHLEISARREITGEEFGKIVRELLSRSQSDESWGGGRLGENLGGSEADPNLFQALVGLVWLHQVTANMEKSSRYAHSRLWASANIERVLQAFL